MYRLCAAGEADFVMFGPGAKAPRSAGSEDETMLAERLMISSPIDISLRRADSRAANGVHGKPLRRCL